MRRASTPGEILRIWSLEMDPKCAAIARELIELAGYSDIVTVIEGAAEDSLRRMNADGTLTQANMVFLDHVESLYVADFKVCEELGLLKEGVVIIADNVVRPGAPDYRKFVREHPRLRSTGVRGLIQPGNFEVCISLKILVETLSNFEQDEFEVTYVVKGET
jgi:catechol O-methyltransferase